MLTSGIYFKNFKVKSKNINIKTWLKTLIKEKNQIILSFSQNYKDSYKKKLIKKIKIFKNYRIIGIGGSSLGIQSIYQFLNYKIKKNFIFIDNLNSRYKK